MEAIVSRQLCQYPNAVYLNENPPPIVEEEKVEEVKEEEVKYYDHGDWAADESLKVWIFVRQDLGMTKGKICSQTSHSTLGLYKDM